MTTKIGVKWAIPTMSSPTQGEPEAPDPVRGFFLWDSLPDE